MPNRDSLSVLLPQDEISNSVAYATVSPLTINPANNVVIPNALDNKDNSLAIFISNSASDDKNATILKSNLYPNALLGDLVLSIPKSSTVCIQLSDPSRFEQKNGDILIDFQDGFSGSVYAVAKKAGL